MVLSSTHSLTLESPEAALHSSSAWHPIFDIFLDSSLLSVPALVTSAHNSVTSCLNVSHTSYLIPILAYFSARVVCLGWESKQRDKLQGSYCGTDGALVLASFSNLTVSFSLLQLSHASKTDLLEAPRTHYCGLYLNAGHCPCNALHAPSSS